MARLTLLRRSSASGTPPPVTEPSGARVPAPPASAVGSPPPACLPEINSAEGSLRLIDVSKRYGRLVALDAVSFAIPAGEFVTILGPSGSGKTTVMRVIGGFVAPDAGRVEISGRDATHIPSFKRDTNTVFQSYALFPHMTVAENVAYGLKVTRVPRAVRSKRVAEMLALVDLEEAAGKLPAQLSGGMRQRVALARALVKEPGVLLLDEPLAALDRKLRESMQIELRRIQRQLQTTFLYVTHDQDEALSMADRVIVMHDGRIEQIGTPDEVYDFPSTVWVGGFVGGTNQLGGLVRGTGEAVELETDIALLLGVSAGGSLARGQRALALVRPEHIRIGDVAARGADNVVRVFIEEIQHVGNHLRYIARTPGGIRLHARAQRTTADAQTLVPGAEVSLSWEANTTRIYAIEDDGGVA